MGRFVRAFLSDLCCHEPFVGLAAHEFLMGTSAPFARVFKSNSVPHSSVSCPYNYSLFFRRGDCSKGMPLLPRKMNFALCLAQLNRCGFSHIWHAGSFVTSHSSIELLCHSTTALFRD